MIQGVELNFPDFGLKLSREFNKGVNLIEEDNGYGKSTLLYTILSFYTKRFIGQRKMPSGTAKITMDNGEQFLYSKGLWVGKEDEPNPLMKFILPGEFFSLGPKEQRETIVKILDIDINKFFTSRVKDWTPTLVKEIKAQLKSNEGKNDIILQDIERLKSIVIQYEKNPVVIQDNRKEIDDIYQKWFAEQNHDAMNIESENSANATKKVRLQSQINQIQYEIDSHIKTRDGLRQEHHDVQTKTDCPTCGGPLPKEKIADAVSRISKKGKELNELILNLTTQKEGYEKEMASIPNPKKIPDKLIQVYDTESRAKALNMKVFTTSQEDLARKSEYDVSKRDLEFKENQLRSLNEVNLNDTLQKIAGVQKEFTEELEKRIKDFGIPDVSLFIERENGDLAESFTIQFDGKDYSELSNGYRNVLHVRMAIAFAKKFGLDFILIDEAGTLGKKAFDLIKKEAKGMQVIAARATPFTLKK